MSQEVLNLMNAWKYVNWYSRLIISWIDYNLKNCFQYIILELDPRISENDYGAVLIEGLKKSELSFKIKTQILPNLVSWSRKVQTIDNMVGITITPPVHF